MPNSKKVKYTNKDGKPICGAQLRKKKGQFCKKAPMSNGRCKLHGGVSTGPKNSAAYFQKQVLEREGMTRLSDALQLEDQKDLTGEIGLVRSLLVEMQDSPLRVYCHGCKQWVTALVGCPNEEEDNANRVADGKRPLVHHVKVRDNDHGKMVTAVKQLSDVVKNHKEIQQGKEITLRIEVINLLVMKVVEAYEYADRFEKPEQRRREFVEAIDRIVLQPTAPASSPGQRYSSEVR